VPEPHNGLQLVGHEMLKSLGISIIPASAPDFFTKDTPTAVLVRQVRGRRHRMALMMLRLSL
jgi:hypothetical protein